MSDIIKPEQKFERVERFQALQAGHFWRCTSSVKTEGIPVGMVLLIQSVRWVDNLPHTIILRSHPSMFNRYIEVQSGDDSDVTHHLRFTEHRFLTKDFMDWFEFEPDHAQIRQKELSDVQASVTALQDEVTEFNTNHATRRRVTEEGIKALALTRGLPEPGNQVAVTSNAQSGNILSGSLVQAAGTGIDRAMIEGLVCSVSEQRDIAEVQSKWLHAKMDEISTAVKASMPFYDEIAAAGMVGFGEHMEYMQKLEDGIGSLNLYIGEGVEVESLCKGSPAPSNLPLTLMQQKLFMAEELAVWVDLDENFDFSNFGSFVSTLSSSPEFVDQIFPTERCVVIMATTRESVDYGNAHTNAALNEINKHVFMLVRNGQNISRVMSSVKTHSMSRLLFPSVDEVGGVFRGVNGADTRFEDLAYTDKLASHERLALHYKRYLILLCGLDHNHNLMGDFYEGPKSFDFVTMEFQEKYFNFIHDADGSGLIEAPSFEPVSSWIARKNALLVSGSRVMCHWNQLIDVNTAPSACEKSFYGTGYRAAFLPEKKFSVVVAVKSGEEVVVKPHVFGVSRLGKSRDFDCRVSLTAVDSSGFSDSAIPYLCLDSIEPEEVGRYIHSRKTRIGHVAYLRMFRRVLELVKSERAAEEGSRLKMLNALIAGGLAAGGEAHSIVNRAVIAWRAANRGADLPGHDQWSNKQWNEILDQMHGLSSGAESYGVEVEKLASTLGLEPLRLVLTGKAKWYLYAAPKADERDNRGEPFAWVHRLHLGRNKAGFTVKGDSWVILPENFAGEVVKQEWDAAVEFSGLSSEFKSPQAKKDYLQTVSSSACDLEQFGSGMGDEFILQMSSNIAAAVKRESSKKKYIQHVMVMIPLFLLRARQGGPLNVYSACLRFPEAYLLGKSQSRTTAATCLKDYVSIAANKDVHSKKIASSAEDPYQWSLSISPISARLSSGINIVGGNALDASRTWSMPEDNPLLDIEIKKQIDAGHDFVCLDDRILSSTGAVEVDKILGNELKDDMTRIKIRYSTVTGCAPLSGGFAPAHNIIRYVDIWPAAVNVERDINWDSFAAAEGSTGRSCSSTSEHAWSHDKAIEKALEASRKDGLIMVSALDLPDHPQPPESVHRWFQFKSGV